MPLGPRLVRTRSATAAAKRSREGNEMMRKHKTKMKKEKNEYEKVLKIIKNLEIHNAPLAAIMLDMRTSFGFSLPGKNTQE